MKRYAVLAIIPLLAGTLTLLPSGVSPSLAARVPSVTGSLVGLPAALIPPTTLTLQSNGTSYTVDISTTTKLVRRFNGVSALDEFAANDQLTVTGTIETGNTIMATRVKDLSIQAAYTRMLGQVTAVSTPGAAPSLTVTVLKDGSGRAPFAPGQSYTLPIGATTQVTANGTTVAGSLNGIVAGEQVTALGVFDRTSRNFVSVARITLHATRVHYQGYLAGLPSSTTPPATLSLTTTGGQITVTVSISTTIVRRYNGQSSLDELSPNDILDVTGQTTGVGSVAATSIKDVSIQAAYTRLVGVVTAVSPTSITVTVRKDEQGRSPFVVGQSIVLPIGSTTKIVLPGTSTAGAAAGPTATPGTTAVTAVTGSVANIAVNNVVTALGVYNRASQHFISTALIRVH